MNKLDIFKCEKCGNIVELLHVGGGQLVCCGQPMKAMTENTTDAAKEKHVPAFEGNKVKVGSVPHPMEEVHYIEWIEVQNEKGICRKFLAPGESPEASFDGFQYDSAREYCNKHGLWKAHK